MKFCPWYSLPASGTRAPAEPGVFQVRVGTGLIEYPRGKSAMIHYGRGDDLREATTAFNAAHPDNEWLCRHVVDVGFERRFQRVLEQFEDRFGAPPSPGRTTNR